MTPLSQLIQEAEKSLEKNVKYIPLQGEYYLLNKKEYLDLLTSYIKKGYEEGFNDGHKFGYEIAQEIDKRFIGGEKKIVFPKTDDTPISVSERLVKEDIRKLTQNSEDIKKLKEQVDRKKEETKSE